MRFFMLVSILAAALTAAAPHPVELTLQDHRFTPAEITVPAGVPVSVHLINRDGALEEFDSEDLGVEQDVTPQGDTRITLPAMKPGLYRFMGELHSDSARGRIVVTAPH
jgi:heme/copper-type cytochrome/quinol oxidase subunit 2